MPRNREYDPTAMEYVSPLVRAKASESANALLDEGHNEAFYIRVAIAARTSGHAGAAWNRRRFAALPCRSHSMDRWFC